MKFIIVDLIFIEKFNIFVIMKYIDEKFNKYQESQRNGDYDIYKGKTKRQQRREVASLIKKYHIYNKIDKCYLDCFDLYHQKLIINKIIPGEDIENIKKLFPAPTNIYRNNKLEELLK